MSPTDESVSIASAFVSIADSWRPGHGVVDAMDALVRAVVASTSVADAGVLLVGPGGSFHVAASTQERAAELEELQIGSITGGPCIDSIRSGAPIEVEQIADAAGRWPEFAKSAVASGYLSVRALPLRVNGETLGGREWAQCSRPDRAPKRRPVAPQSRRSIQPGDAAALWRRGFS
jgi:hypothetical protein